MASPLTTQAPATWGEVLDELAHHVFAGPEGERRLTAVVGGYDAIVGAPHPDDLHWELFQAHRVDWALCEAQIPGGSGIGDTWLARLGAGVFGDVEIPPAWTPVRSTYCGLFEVWPATTTFIRDRLRGLCVPLVDEVQLEPVRRGAPAALWELRVVFEQGYARMCRPPLPYPMAVLELLEDLQRERWRELCAPLDPRWLRRALLRYVRATRLDPEVVFKPALAAARQQVRTSSARK